MITMTTPEHNVPGPTVWGPALCLLSATAVAALGGVPLGVALAYWAATGQMASVNWVGLVQAHGQMQIFGWLALAVLGVTFHAMSHLFRAPEPPARLSIVVLSLQLAGVALRLVAPLIPGAGSAWLLLASAVAFLAAFAITLEAHMRTMSRRQRQGEHRAPAVLPRFLLSGLLLWFIALLVNLDGALDAVRHGPVAAGAISAGRDAFIVAAMSGGLALIALGMSLRVAAGWADLPRPDFSRATQAWWLLVAATWLRAGLALAPALPESMVGVGSLLSMAAGLLWAAGVCWYVPALRGLWSPSVVLPGGGSRGEADPPLAWFVRVAYIWLMVSAALGAGEAISLLAAASGMGDVIPSVSLWSDAGRHALLLGYLGMLTAGLSGRLPGAFLDVGDAAVTLTRTYYRAAFACLALASVLRVTAPFLGVFRSWLIVTAGVAASAGLCLLLAVVGQIVWLAYRRSSRRMVVPALRVS